MWQAQQGDHLGRTSFKEEIYRRYGDPITDVVEEFNKLKQEGAITEYQEKFKELQSLILMVNPTLSEAYFISSLISGLKEELKPTIKIFKPQILNLAYKQA